MRARLALLVFGTALLGASAVSMWRKTEASRQTLASTGWYFPPQPTAFDRFAFLAGVTLVVAAACAFLFSYLRYLWRKSS